MEYARLFSKAAQSLPRIAIVGGGQAGLPLALALKRMKFQAHLFSDQTPMQIKNSRVTASPVLFSTAMAMKNEMVGESLFKDPKTLNQDITVTIANEQGDVDIQWRGQTRGKFQWVDPRINNAVLMQRFENLGGRIHYSQVTHEKLNEISHDFDLIVVAAGRASILNQLFPRKEELCEFNTPQRTLALQLVKNIKLADSNHFPQGVRTSIIPNLGEFFYTPGQNGYAMLIEGIPGSDFDCFNQPLSPQEHITLVKKIIKEKAPWEYPYCENIELIDSKAYLTGSITPTIRESILELDNGTFAIAIGDAKVLFDPIAAQGANHAIRMAYYTLQKLREDFSCFRDRQTLQQIMDDFWNGYGSFANEWTNMMLKPVASHILDAFKAAENSPEIANGIVNGFDDPKDTLSWLKGPETTEKFIQDNTVQQKNVFQ